ncbi:MAG: hypothetical protein AABY22_24470 [Nanoarchaeota archaeon]
MEINEKLRNGGKTILKISFNTDLGEDFEDIRELIEDNLYIEILSIDEVEE